MRCPASGRVDGMIANPDGCWFDPTTLLCTDEDARDPSRFLIRSQVDGLREFYSPILNTGGRLLYSRFDPGAEGDMTYGFGMSGVTSPLPEVKSQPITPRNKKLSLVF